jgi:hypothetical protein
LKKIFKMNSLKIIQEIKINSIPPEVPPAAPEKGTAHEVNKPFRAPEEIKPVHEVKTHPDKK